jgi:hypothetical protein
LIENEHYTSDGAANHNIFLLLHFQSDHRDFKSYHLKGYYIDFAIVKHGLWTFKTNTLNTFHVMATFRKFWEMNPRLYFASGLNGKISAGQQPYFILQGIGFDRDVVRSYEYYLVDAQHFFILKNNIKFAIIPTTVKNISFIKTEKFGKIFYALYMNVFLMQVMVSTTRFRSCNQRPAKPAAQLWSRPGLSPITISLWVWIFP